MISKIKKTALKFKRVLVTPLRLLKFYREGIIDSSTYLRFAKVLSSDSQCKKTHLESDIIRRYHIIEKGLSMPDFRSRFGESIVSQLHIMLIEWEKNYAYHSQVASAWKVLEAYHKKHQELGVDVSDLTGEFQGIPEAYRRGAEGGVKSYEPVQPGDCDAFTRVIKGRVSVRNFQIGVLPSPETIKKSISAAISTPSVCNRQAWRTHSYQGEEVQKILEVQNGNRGFGHTIPQLLIITVDMRYFVDSIERYQPWIDGGMFSMSLLLALHAEGVGAVPLNWAVDNHQDKILRDRVTIPKFERIIMMIGCGVPQESIEIPKSSRRSVGEIMVS